MRLKGKVCVITGAGQGIGRTAAELFAREEARVVIAEVDEQNGRQAEAAIGGAGGRAEFVRTDVSNARSVRACFDRLRRTYGRIDVLYNNASVYLAGQDARVTDLEPAVWDRVLATNLTGVLHCCRCGIPLMMEGGGGSVITTASSAGVIGIPGCDAYTASKGGTVALTRSLAVEYGPYKVRTNCIAPAAIMTPMMRQSNPEDSGTFDEEDFLKRRTPLRRYGTPEEIARLALFLASDESSYLNGAVFAADGGITICGDLSRSGGEA